MAPVSSRICRLMRQLAQLRLPCWRARRYDSSRMKGVWSWKSDDAVELARWEEIRRDSLQMPVSWWEGSSDLKGRL